MLVRTAEPVSGKVFNSSTSCAAGDIDPHPDEFTFGASVELSGTARSVTNKNTRDLALLSEADETKLKNSILQYHRFVVSKVLCTFSKRTAQITEKRTHALIYCRHSRIYPGRVNRKQWSKPDLGILFPGSYDVWSWSHSTLPAVRDPV